MVLTQLEADLLMHVAREECSRADIDHFVRQHHDGPSAEDAARFAEEILARWAERGWIDPDTGSVRLTEQARREVGWLPLAAGGPLRRVGSPGPASVSNPNRPPNDR